MGDAISFRCPDGSDCAGYLAEATEATKGIVVLQEWWGLNDQIRGVAERFAAAGITALAPDLYGGRVTSEPDEAEHLMTGLDWPGACKVEVRGALQHLKATLAKVAVTGYCMGGALTIIAAAKLAECDAAVCFYGIPPEDQARPTCRCHSRATSRTTTIGARRTRWTGWKRPSAPPPSPGRSTATTPPTPSSTKRSRPTTPRRRKFPGLAPWISWQSICEISGLGRFIHIAKSYRPLPQ
jgi:dienelactone hydrolase